MPISKVAAVPSSFYLSNRILNPRKDSWFLSKVPLRAEFCRKILVCSTVSTPLMASERIYQLCNLSFNQPILQLLC